MKILLLSTVFVVAFTTLNYAQKTEISLEDAVLGQWRQFYPERMNNLTWRKDKDQFTFLSDDERNVMVQQAESPNSRVLFSIDDLNTAINEEFETIPPITFESPSEFSFQYRGRELWHISPGYKWL